MLIPRWSSLWTLVLLVLLGTVSPTNGQELKFSKPRVLEIGERLANVAVNWDWLTLSPDGKLLVADGEVADNSGLKHVGMTRETREYLSLWNLSNYRHITTQLMADNFARRLVPRFTMDGKLIYGHARENQIRESAENGEMRFADAKQRAGIMHWPRSEKEPYVASLLAPPEGLIIASHLDSKQLFGLQGSVGIQSYSIEVLPAHKGRSGNRVREYVKFKQQPDVQALPEPVLQPATFSFDGSRLVASVREGKAGVLVWDVNQKKLVARLSVEPDSTSKGKDRQPKARGKASEEKKDEASEQSTQARVENISVSHNANVVAFSLGGRQGWRAYVFDPSNPVPIDSVGPFQAAISTLSLNSDGSRLMYVTGGGAFVREVTSGKQVQLTDNNIDLEVGTISADGSTVVASGSNGLIQVWNDLNTWGKQELPQQSQATIEVKSIPTLKLPTSKPATPKQIEWYHALHSRRMLVKAIGFSSSPDNFRSLDELKFNALERQKFIGQDSSDVSQAFAKLYGDLAAGFTEMQPIAQQIFDTQTNINAQVLKFAAERTKAEAHGRLHASIGLTKIMASALTMQRDYTGSEERGSTTIHHYDEYEAIPGFGEEGLMQMLAAAFVTQQRREALKELENAANDETVQTLSEALRKKDLLINRLQTHWNEVTSKLGSIPPVVSLAKRPKFEEIVLIMEKDAEHYRALSGRDDPFTLADLAMFKSSAPSTLSPIDRAYFKSAELLKLVSTIPEGSMFDSDRAELIGMAASEINRVAEASLNNQKFREANQKKSSLAIAILDLALQLNPSGQNGNLRHHKALAHLHLGQVPEAIEEINQSIKETGENANALALLARLECLNGRVNVGLDHLEEAVVKLGYRNLRDLKSWSGFPKTHERFKSLTEMSIGFHYASFADAMKIANKGVFTLHNVKIRVEYVGTYNQTSKFTEEARLLSLAPGEVYHFATEKDPEKCKLFLSAQGLGSIEALPTPGVFKF